MCLLLRTDLTLKIHIADVPKKLSPFEHFHNSSNCLVLSDVNDILLLKGSFGSILFYAIFLLIKRPPKYGFFKNRMLEKPLKRWEI